MESLRQKTRPKHQILILRCYPKMPKGSDTTDAKPNSSELSYLLFYASTRRSKLQKVGTFLEKKTSSDVYKQRSGSVGVTLQILHALLEQRAVGEDKTGFALIAPYILRILGAVLQETNDVALIEASVGLWEEFCAHQDDASLASDHEYRQLYEGVVVQWTRFAHKDKIKKLGQSTQAAPANQSMRLREVGLTALRAVLVADGTASDSGRQLHVLIPAVLSNLQAESGNYLEHLQRERVRNEEEVKRKAAMHDARPSIVSLRTDTGSVETNPRAAEANTSDADHFAEENVALLALGCLKAVFSPDQRGQVRPAVAAVLQYLTDRANNKAQRSRPNTAEKLVVQHGDDTWSIALFELITAWTPVQNRFIALITLTETLLRLPLTREGDIPQHTLFASMLDETLRSDLNLIGLSVMDILLGLLRHIARVLSLRLMGSENEQLQSPSKTVMESTYDTLPRPPTGSQQALLHKLKSSIAALAVHVYYTDQISDMASAILSRLRASPERGSQGTVPAAVSNGPRPASAVTEDGKSGSSTPSRGRSITHGSSHSKEFTADAAKITALEAVHDIFTIANRPRVIDPAAIVDEGKPLAKVAGEERARTPVDVWVGTEYNVGDSTAPGVRIAYEKALLTWAKIEALKVDWTLSDCLEAIRTAKAHALAPSKSFSRRSRRSPSNPALAATTSGPNFGAVGKGDHRRMLRVADYSPGRDSSLGRSPSSSAAAAKVPRVEDLKRILQNEPYQASHQTWSTFKSDGAGRSSYAKSTGGGEDTASESVMDVGDIDIGSDASGNSRIASVRSNIGKRNIKMLLASIKIDETREERSQRPKTARMVSPPY